MDESEQATPSSIFTSGEEMRTFLYEKTTKDSRLATALKGVMSGVSKMY